MRNLALSTVTLLASQFDFAAAAERKPAVNIGTAGATVLLEEVSTADPADRPPAGTPLAFVRDDQIYLLNADGTGLTQLTDTGDGVANRDPAWSPDGRWIAYASSECRTCQSSIRFAHVDGNTEGLIVDNGHSPAWRPEAGARIDVGHADAL